MTVALFCGSREWADPEPVRAEIARLEPGDIVIHGDQRGADLIADTEGRRAGLEVVSMAADWDLGPAAGPLRNDRMLRTLLAAGRTFGQPVRVLAFHHDLLLGVGTRDMVRKSMRAGMRVRAFLSKSVLVDRVGTHMECEDCGVPYLRHPDVTSETDWNGDPFLHLSCRGQFLKL